MKILSVLLIMMCIASSAFAAAPPPASKSSPTVAKATPKRPASRAGSTRTSKPRESGTPRVSSAKPSPAASGIGKAPGREGPRTLQDIHIEGEIPVPQVLFITARDQRRFLDFHHRRYLKTSQQVGEQTVLPSWIGVTGQQPTDAGKENPR